MAATVVTRTEFPLCAPVQRSTRRARNRVAHVSRLHYLSVTHERTKRQPSAIVTSAIIYFSKLGRILSFFAAAESIGKQPPKA